MQDIIPQLIKRVESQHNIVSSLIWNGMIYQPATLETLEAAEVRLGFGLPSLLRDILTRVANGGIGPGYGLFGLVGGAPAWIGPPSDDPPIDIVDYYHLTIRSQNDEITGQDYNHFYGPWPQMLLPICSWGCSMGSHLDCSKPEAPVVFSDEMGYLYQQCESFEKWMAAWLARVDLMEGYQLYLPYNPLPGSPRF